MPRPRKEFSCVSSRPFRQGYDKGCRAGLNRREHERLAEENARLKRIIHKLTHE